MGFFADIALVIFGILTLALYKLIPVVLTLPGIAGFLLSVGMAVDSNILIFERFKEEKLKRRYSDALEVSFGRAWDSIRDANIATLFTAFILANPFDWNFLHTSGPVRGFAITLALGIGISLFTGIVVSRNLLRVFVREKKMKGVGGYKMIDWMKYRLVYLTVSVLVLGAGVFGLFQWGLKIGVDFTGGSIIEYKFKDVVSTEDATGVLQEKGVNVSSVQITGDGTYLFRFAPLSEGEKEKISLALTEKFNDGYEELRFENVGPSMGPELIRKTVVAIALSAVTILLWVAYQFKSIKYGASAVIGMFHDSIVLIGLFSLLGHFFGAEVDFLFVTALLTILSFSVHDTIVNYDRLRELQRKSGSSFYDLANKATTQTMVRSLNNSFTIIFMLAALMLLGGTTVKWFAAALLIGTVSGTYSSPFVSVAILVTWDQIEKKLKLRKSK